MTDIPWIYKKLSPIEARIYRAVEACGDCGANKAAICSQCADEEVYGSCHDYKADNRLLRLATAATPKYHRNFNSLVDAKVLVCVNRRNSIYKINE